MVQAHFLGPQPPACSVPPLSGFIWSPPSRTPRKDGEHPSPHRITPRKPPGSGPVWERLEGASERPAGGRMPRRFVTFFSRGLLPQGGNLSCARLGYNKRCRLVGGSQSFSGDSCWPGPRCPHSGGVTSSSGLQAGAARPGRGARRLDSWSGRSLVGGASAGHLRTEGLEGIPPWPAPHCLAPPHCPPPPLRLHGANI